MSKPATQVVGRRTGAFILDNIILWAIGFALFFALATKGLPELGDDGKKLNPYWDLTLGDDAYFVQGGQAWIWMGLLLFVLVDLAVVMQSVVGASPGKLVFGLRVVDAQGEKAGFGANVVRLLGWIVDGAPWFFLWGLAGFVTALNAKGNRRVGDMWAKTYVVRAAAVGQPVGVDGLVNAPVVVPGPMPAPPPARTGAGSGAERDAFGNPIVPSQSLWQDPAPAAPVEPVDRAYVSEVPSEAPPAGGAPADWYPDPTGRARLRYWNGSAWTDHTAA